MRSLRILLCTSALATAQVYTPPTETPTPPPAPNSNTINRDAPDKPKQPSAFGNDLPFLDPSAETISWNGHNWSGMDNRLMAARFERYLNEPEENSGAALEYRQTIQDILEKISPHHPGGPDFAAGVRLLPKASSFPSDAKLCDSLSQAIYTSVLAKKDVNATRALNSGMEEERQRLIRNGDMAAKAAKPQDKAPAPKGGKPAGDGGGGVLPGGNGKGTQSLEYLDTQKRLLEIDALKKANMGKGELQIMEAKIQYQALMMQFFVQRRFEHVLMASRFYNQIFRDGDSKLYIDKNSDMAKLFSEGLGTSPTVGALDAMASEAIRDVDQGVQAFVFLVDKSEFQSASKRLSETYLTGEFMPSVKTLPRESKRRVLKFVQEGYKLIGALDAKDYTLAKQLVDDLKKMSNDFDSGKAEAAIATYSRVSDMHITAAKAAAAGGDTAGAQKEIQSAMEVWPQNPKLAEFDKLVESKGTMSVAQGDFDRLLSEGNYREILKRQYEFAPAIHGDARREDAFKQVITNLSRIEVALGKAAEFSKAGQQPAAWEQLATIRKEFPDDPKLGREMELLAPQDKVSSFTGALDQAQQFEKRGEIGSSLSWYLKARSINLTSDLAKEGIDRMVKEMLPEGK
ncbi:MAG: hypothetical protein JWO82_146 [Akkermansiaceae bacterium]|nr:hypothetical protein [Akkermansiaceae bacterium]